MQLVLLGCIVRRLGAFRIAKGEMYQAFIFSKENGDAGIDFADSEGYEHVGLGRELELGGLFV